MHKNDQKTPPQGSYLQASSKHRFYDDSADQLETSNIITEQMILSEDSSSMALIESRGLPRVTSSPGPLRFESSAEASSFLTQSNSLLHKQATATMLMLQNDENDSESAQKFKSIENRGDGKEKASDFSRSEPPLETHHLQQDREAHHLL